MSFLLFQPVPPMGEWPAGGVAVIGRRGRSMLGVISWYPPWRQHVFEAKPETVWSDGCLAEVRLRVAAMNAERAAERAAVPT